MGQDVNAADPGGTSSEWCDEIRRNFVSHFSKPINQQTNGISPCILTGASKTNSEKAELKTQMLNSSATKRTPSKPKVNYITVSKMVLVTFWGKNYFLNVIEILFLGNATVESILDDQHLGKFLGAFQAERE